MKPETKLKIGDTVIDARDLDHNEKVAFIEFAIHLAAPRIAELLAGEVQTEELKTTEHDNLLFEMPPTLTVQEVADYLRVSKSRIYEMCRIHHGKFFPHFKVGKSIKVPRDKFIDWINNGGLDHYQQGVASEGLKRQQQPLNQRKAESVAQVMVKEKKPTPAPEPKKPEPRIRLSKKEAAEYLGVLTLGERRQKNAGMAAIQAFRRF